MVTIRIVLLEVKAVVEAAVVDVDAVALVVVVVTVVAVMVAKPASSAAA